MKRQVSEEKIGGVTLKMHEDTKVGDLAGADKVIIGRDTNGDILIVMPPSVLGVTFMLLSGNHMPVNCAFVSALAYHMKNDDVVASGVVAPDLLELILKSVKGRHDGRDFEETLIRRGTPEEFDGLYWGSIQPVELAGIAVVLQEILTAAGNAIKSHPTIYDVMRMWVEAASTFVTDVERMALLGSNDGTA